MKKVIPSGATLVPDSAELVFEGKIFNVYQWPQKLFDGSTQVFEMLKRTDTVIVIGIVEDKILVIQDEQPHLGSRQSFPGGRVDATDASVEAAARREVEEETGYSFNNWRLVGVRQPYRKMEWFVYVLLAWDVSAKQEPHLDAGEKIQFQLMDFDKVKELVIDKAGYLGDNDLLFKQLKSIDDLMSLSEFSGTNVDR